MSLSPVSEKPSIVADDFRAALKNREISLNYQPIVNMKTRVVEGFEALMRWTHPTLGPISPGIFIPIAEESGLIVDASQWALREACRALKRIEGRAPASTVTIRPRARGRLAACTGSPTSGDTA